MRTVIEKTILEDPDCAAEIITLAPDQRLAFRPLKAGDAAMLTRYFLSLSPDTCGWFSPHAFTAEEAEKLCAEIESRQVIRLVAVTQDAEPPEIVAYFILGFGLGEGDLKRYGGYGMPLDQASVCTIAPSVSDAYQGRGLGRAAMAQALSLARRLERSRVVLQGGVQARNARAIHFYERFGFRKVGSFSTACENYDMTLDLANDTAPNT